MDFECSSDVSRKLGLGERHEVRFIWQFQGDRVTVAAGIRLSTWRQKVDTLKWILTGIVLPDDDFDITNRSVRSRATGICIFYHFLYIFIVFHDFSLFFDVFN